MARPRQKKSAPAMPSAPSEAAAAFALIEPQLDRVEEVAPINVDIPRAVAIAGALDGPRPDADNTGTPGSSWGRGRFFSFAWVVMAAVLAACQSAPDRRGSGGGDAGASGSGGGDAGASGSGGGTAGAPGSGGGTAGSSGSGAPVPDAGRCVEGSRLEYRPSLPFEAVAVRLPDGFALALGTGTRQDLSVAVGNEQNEWREYAAGETLPDAARDPRVVVAGTARDPHILVAYSQNEGAGNEGAIMVHRARPDGTIVGPERALDAFIRGTAENLVAASADGERVALGNAHVAWDPRMILLDKDGRKVSDALLLIDSGGEALADCFSLTGTKHGVLAHVVNEDTGELRVVELDAAGDIVQDVTWPMPEGAACPHVSVDPGGIYFAFQDAGLTGVYSLDGGTLTKIASLPRTTAGNPNVWVLGGEEPLIRADSPSGSTFARLVNGGLVALSGEVSGSVISTRGDGLSVADGRVFSMSRSDDAASIVEVVCGAAGHAPSP